MAYPAHLLEFLAFLINVSSILPFAPCKTWRKWREMVRIAWRFLPFLA